MTFETKLNKTGNIVSSDISKESSEKAFKDSVITGVNLEQSKCVMSNLKNYIFWLRTRGDVVRKGYFYACIGVMNKHQHAYSVHSFFPYGKYLLPFLWSFCPFLLVFA